MRVLICGDRNWKDCYAVQEVVEWLDEKIQEEITIIEGEAKGADTCGRIVSEILGFDLEKYPAEWNRYGRGAGPIRNQQMLNSGLDFVVAFHDDIENSKGTLDMITKTTLAGVPTILVKHTDEAYWEWSWYGNENPEFSL